MIMSMLMRGEIRNLINQSIDASVMHICIYMYWSLLCLIEFDLNLDIWREIIWWLWPCDENRPHFLLPGQSVHLQSAHLQGSPFLPQPQSGDYIRDQGDQDGEAIMSQWQIQIATKNLSLLLTKSKKKDWTCKRDCVAVYNFQFIMFGGRVALYNICSILITCWICRNPPERTKRCLLCTPISKDLWDFIWFHLEKVSDCNI